MTLTAKNRALLRTILIITLIIGIICLIAPTIITSYYSVFIDDDFEHAATVERIHETHPSYLVSSWLFMTDKYMNWQGNYFSMFIQALLSPANQGGFRQLRITMVANSVLFFSTFFSFIYVMLGRIGIKRFDLRLLA